MKLIVKIVSELHQGKKYEVDLFPISIGRLKNNGIQIAFDMYISRAHCTIYKDQSNLYIIDMKSKNGTYVNDILIHTPVIIKNGDIITLGNTRLNFSTE